MDIKRKPSAAPILVAIAIGLLVALLGAYLTGYFWLSELATSYGMPARPRVVRVYRSRLLAEIFTPAAMIESAVSPRDVDIAPQSDPLLSSQ